MLVLTQNQAKAKADTLHKFLVERGVTLPKSDLLNAVARMAGFEDWNAMASEYRPEAVDAQLQAFEQKHVKDAIENTQDSFGRETCVQTPSGFWLVSAAYPHPVDYIRVCDPLGREIVYWSEDEFGAAPSEVLGAMMGAINRSRCDRMPDFTNPVADKLVVADRTPKKQKVSTKRTGLSEMDWDKVFRIAIGSSENEEFEYYRYNSADEDVLPALDAEREGRATAEDLELLHDYADTIVLDWGDEFEAEGLTASELRGMQPMPNGAWKLKDGRELGFMRLEMIP